MYIQIKNTLKNKFNHIHKKTLKLLIIKIVNFIYNNSKIQVKSIISFSPLIVFFFFFMHPLPSIYFEKLN
jgi:hypothetical protein